MPGSDSKGNVRGWLGRLFEWLGWGRPRTARYSVAFTTAFVALAAKLAKADGVAVHAEWVAFERFLEVPESERANVRRIYDLAKQNAAGVDAHAQRLNALLAGDERLKRDVLDCLLCVACSDGILHPDEDKVLRGIAETLGFPPEEYVHIRALFVRDPDSPYEVLGLAPDASDAEVKSRYRAVVAEAHPDRAIAAGAPPAVVKAANTKVAAINAAYDAILEERRMRGAKTAGRP